ncbi:MAG: 50S ribosomal protein L31 [Candidatus Moraniibacteriota bacterium]|nr:MAG: 50S ribosomal protein L31 [Candidatus Moranbacteria bacterium]
MKDNIHPNYFTKIEATCSCGAALSVGATQEKIQTEICSSCHPVYTGKKKTLDTTGRVDRFKRMAQKAQEKQEEDIRLKEEKKKREEIRSTKIEEEAKKPSKKVSKKKSPATKK